jgi:glycosyltransferase involved in cell wall biosynthesis
MQAISELFDETCLIVPVAERPQHAGEVSIVGERLSVVPLAVPVGKDLARKFALPVWLVRNFPIIAREITRADAVHTPIPGDVGTFGLLFAMMLRKPLFVRYCGNWCKQSTAAEHFWRLLLERCTGDRIVVLATGGANTPPSRRNANVRWIFSSSLRERELAHFGSVRAGFDARAPRLMIACRQEKRKGTGAVIESLLYLAGDYPGISLDVVGDGAALPDFRRIAYNTGVADRVRFHGKVDHAGVMVLLKSADLFCFPTTSSEGFPKAVLEALAFGLPVVTTRVSVLPELVGCGGGILLDNATPEEVARGVRWCLADNARYQMLSAAAIRTASQYSIERWRDTIASFLAPAWGSLRSANA